MQSNPLIINNFITNNSTQVCGGGVYAKYDSNPTIVNNVIIGNSAAIGGGGFSCSYSNPTFVNNTLSLNIAASGGGFYCYGYAWPIVANNIFWADSATTGNEIYIQSGLPIITYCNVQGGWTGVGNIDCDPWFCYPDTGNFYIAENSCCVGAGCDSLGNPDSAVNIGALGIGCGEHTDISEQLYTLPIRLSLSQNYPNPFNATTSITFSLPEPQFVTLKIYDLLGREVQVLLNRQLQAGTHVIGFDASELTSSIYFYRLQAADFSETKKMLLLK